MVVEYRKLDARYSGKDPTVMAIVCVEMFIMAPLCILWWVYCKLGEYGRQIVAGYDIVTKPDIVTWLQG